MYRGQSILQDENFLRRLPLSLNPVQRLTIEGLVHIADSLSASYKILYDIALKWALSEDEILSTFERATMFNCAWSIVDDIHSARQLFQRLVKNEAPPGGFRYETQEFKRLRDKMDHLSDNIGNLVAAKGIRRPIFGSLSFLYVGPQHVSSRGGTIRIEKGLSYTITAGTISDREVFQVMQPHGAAHGLPIDDIILGAFDQDVHLGHAIELFDKAIKSLSAETEASCRAEVERMLGAGEEAEQELARCALYGVTMIAALEFSDEPFDGAG